MVGITRRTPAKGVTIWRNPKEGRKIEPLERFGIKMMSAQFLIGPVLLSVSPGAK